MADAKSPVYIGIPEHVDARRDLLMSSKDLLGSLKAYETVKEIRSKRAELTFELHRVMDEIAVLAKKTKMNLPKPPAKLAFPAREETDEERPTKRGKKPNEDKLGMLDSEISKIEARLNRLE